MNARAFGTAKKWVWSVLGASLSISAPAQARGLLEQAARDTWNGVQAVHKALPPVVLPAPKPPQQSPCNVNSQTCLTQ
jgi:hypothetical protein